MEYETIAATLEAPVKADEPSEHLALEHAEVRHGNWSLSLPRHLPEEPASSEIRIDRAVEPAESVAARAYQLWESGGREPGRDFDYWLEAERQILEKARARN